MHAGISLYETIDINDIGNSTSETNKINHSINIEMHGCNAYGTVKEERMEQNTSCETGQVN